MPNQSNFRSDVTTATSGRYTASRIVSVDDNFILNEELPASFGFDNEDNIEIHFYSIPDNELILSAVVNINDGMLKSHIVSYVDDTFKKYIRIDFTKLFIDKNLILAPNDYLVTLNFFSDEIGSYDDRILTLQTISPSRTEVELIFNNITDEVARETALKSLKEFIEPAFNKPDAVGVAEKIFTAGVVSGDDEEGITSNVIAQSFAPTVINQMDNLALYDTFQIQLNNFLLELFTFIREEIIIKGDDRIQRDEFEAIIRSTVLDKIKELQKIVDSRIKIT
jgi:hypothetical protein